MIDCFIETVIVNIVIVLTAAVFEGQNNIWIKVCLSVDILPEIALGLSSVFGHFYPHELAQKC